VSSSVCLTWWQCWAWSFAPMRPDVWQVLFNFFLDFSYHLFWENSKWLAVPLINEYLCVICLLQLQRSRLWYICDEVCWLSCTWRSFSFHPTRHSSLSTSHLPWYISWEITSSNLLKEFQSLILCIENKSFQVSKKTHS
jgi:hypothetical protein